MKTSKNSKVKAVRIELIDVHVGRRLRELRLINGMSQQSVASVIHVSIQQVQKYENGTNRISSGKLYQIAQFLKVPIAYFYENLCDANPHSVVNSIRKLKESNSEDSVRLSEITSLVRSYSLIEDTIARKRILNLVKTLSTFQTSKKSHDLYSSLEDESCHISD